MGANSREHSLSTKATNPAPRRASFLDSPAPHLRADPPSSGLPSMLLATANSSCSCQATGEPVSPSEARLTRGGQTQTPINGGQAGQGHWEAWPLGPKPVLVVFVPVSPSFQVLFLESSDLCIQCSWLSLPFSMGAPGLLERGLCLLLPSHTTSGAQNPTGPSPAQLLPESPAPCSSLL